MDTESNVLNYSILIDVNEKLLPLQFGAGINLRKIHRCLGVGMGDDSVKRSALSRTLKEFVPFTDWMKGNTSNDRVDLINIVIQKIDMFGKRIGFMNLDATIVDEAGVALPGIVFLRGASVAVLLLLECEGEQSIVLVEQYRVPAASRMLELPAGMMDGKREFIEMGIAELREETLFEVTNESLIDITPPCASSKGVYPSPGGCDEYIRILSHHRQVTRDEMNGLEGRLAGNRKAGEKITVRLIPVRDIRIHTTDMKVYTALFLYNAMLSDKAQSPERGSKRARTEQALM